MLVGASSEREGRALSKNVSVVEQRFEDDGRQRHWRCATVAGGRSGTGTLCIGAGAGVGIRRWEAVCDGRQRAVAGATSL